MSILLKKNVNQPQSKNLVFTSAGDNSNLEHWLNGKSDFDLWISYYGNEEGKFSDISDYYIAKKGGKFPGLHYIYSHWKGIVDKYDAIFVMDDDLIISGSDIDELFRIRKKYDLWVLQPAFDPRGKVSHGHTKVHLFSFLRYTNFIEVGCPLFRKDKLDDFMAIYDPRVICLGVDFWFAEALLSGSDADKYGAIIDNVSCINPKDIFKKNGREINNLQSDEERDLCWNEMKKEKNVLFDANNVRVFSSVLLTPNYKNIKVVFKNIAVKYYCKCSSSIKKRFG